MNYNERRKIWAWDLEEEDDLILQRKPSWDLGEKQDFAEKIRCLGDDLMNHLHRSSCILIILLIPISLSAETRNDLF